MADNYQDRPFPTDAEHDRGALRDESSLLAKLAQLTGSDPFSTAAKTFLPLQARVNARPQNAEASAPPWSPPRMQRARQEYEEPAPEYPIPVLPLDRYA